MIFPSLIVMRPALTGNLNRRGPALPGLKYSTPLRVSCFGTWLWPEITTLESRGFRLQIELRQVVQHINGKAADLDNFRLWQLARPCILVDVAANGGNWRDGCECGKDIGRADISRVNDVL